MNSPTDYPTFEAMKIRVLPPLEQQMAQARIEREERKAEAGDWFERQSLAAQVLLLAGLMAAMAGGWFSLAELTMRRW